MSLVILTQSEVIEKSVKDYTRPDGTVTQFYNVKLGNREKCESQTISVPKDLYLQLKEGETVKLKGLCGGVGNEKWFSFKELVK